MDDKDVEIIKKEIVYDGHFKMAKYHLKHRLFSGDWSEPFARELFERGDAVCLLLYDAVQDSVVLLEQFRPGALGRDFEPWLLEIVAGVIEPGETKEEVACREAKEEAGVTIKNVHLINDFLSSPGGMSERVYLYYALVDATNIGGVHGLEHEYENIKVHVVPRRKAYSWVQNGKIKNAMTIVALQWLQLNRNRKLKV